jgi:predicted nucleic-acid-binding Zn-ribbon protein
MRPLSEEQKAALTDYLSRKPKKCKNCGATDWEFGEIEIVAAELVFSDSQKVEPSPGPFVELTCRSCGSKETVDCDEAGLSDC